MEFARRLILRHRRLATWLVALALCMKILVPVGFMPVMADGRITIQICPGTAPVTSTAPDHEAGMAMSGHHDPDQPDPTNGHQTPAIPCAFAGLAAPMLAAIDPIILAIAIAVLLATALRMPDRPLHRPALYLRPPLRGPPATC